MTFCLACGDQIPAPALCCPQCGALVAQVCAPRPAAAATAAAAPSLWLPGWAVLCGLLSTLGLFHLEAWTPDQALGVCLFAALAIVLGSAALARQRRGHDLAIAALVLGAISLLGALSALAA